MNIKVKNIGVVDVWCRECPTYECFTPHHFQHRNMAIDGETVSTVDKNLSCACRNYNGCPDKPKIKAL